MAAHKELRCSSCGTLSAFGSQKCPSCNTPFKPEKDAVDVADILTDIGSLMTELDAPFGNQAEIARTGGQRTQSAGASESFVRPQPPLKADLNKDGVEEEAYQCLVCGATIPSDADKCRICGTIFMSEHVAKSFKGVPVSKIGVSDEIDPEEMDIRQSPQHHRSEEIPVEVQLPKSGSLQQLRQSDVMPVVESTVTKKTVVKKKVALKKTGN